MSLCLQSANTKAPATTPAATTCVPKASTTLSPKCKHGQTCRGTCRNILLRIKNPIADTSGKRAHNAQSKSSTGNSSVRLSDLHVIMLNWVSIEFALRRIMPPSRHLNCHRKLLKESVRNKRGDTKAVPNNSANATNHTPEQGPGPCSKQVETGTKYCTSKKWRPILEKSGPKIVCLAKGPKGQTCSHASLLAPDSRKIWCCSSEKLDEKYSGGTPKCAFAWNLSLRNIWGTKCSFTETT